MATKNKIILLFALASLLTCACSEQLLSCLSSDGVTNFSTYDAPRYLHLLDHSIQNLRYAIPSINKPYAVILPESTQQVVTAIQCSRAGLWDIRLRSGGHSFEGLSSVSDMPFVIIDMMNLNHVTVDLESETAWVEAGATLGEVYHAIGTSSNHYAFSAGICPTVGSGGHISGGGYGPLARKYGLAADNVVDAVLVDADGRVLNRETMGEEVFWAIRGGGGGNWGVVVSWKIQLLKVPETITVFHSIRTGQPSQTAELWNKWQYVAPELEDDFFLMVLVVPDIESAGIAMTFVGVYLGLKSSALESMDRAFPELGLTEEECKEMRWIEIVLYLWGVDNVEFLKDRSTFTRTFSKSKADVVRDPIPMDGIKGMLEMYAKQPKGSFRLEPYGGMMSRIRRDASPFPHRASTMYAIEYFVDWEEADDDKRDEYVDWVRGVHEYMTPFVSNSPRAVCVNNIDLDLGVIDWSNRSTSSVDAVEVARSWGEKYFMENYDRLVRAKSMIDPSNVFSHKQSIPTASLEMML
ncbi:reticuline oxidase-like [Magnolia sinica]|uniref:reticuline oxidase-like n=1 Tax=Magnolia sinica TaxID=86752 RepID=UPI002659E013|nr:reticuline oxidase-like [Magnolia sinica]